MIVRESPDELTLKAEEVGTWKKKDGVSLRLITTGVPLARRRMKVSKEKIGKICEKKRDKISTLGRGPQRPNCCVGQSPKVRGSSV